MMPLFWNKCDGDHWCPFLNVDLAHPHFFRLEGVYVIWLAGNGRAVRSGKGQIAERLREHRRAPWVPSYSQGHLLVTWAAVPSSLQDGVERYLHETMDPIENKQHPQQAPAIEVNLPGAPLPPPRPLPLPPR